MSQASFQVVGINHIGIAAKDPETARRFFSEILPLPFVGSELVKDQNTMTHMFLSANQGPKEDLPRLELLEHGPGDSWPIESFMDKKGGGIHHIALNVSDLEASLLYLKERGVRLIDEKPRSGAHNTQIAFIHPHSTGGILIELVQAQ